MTLLDDRSTTRPGAARRRRERTAASRTPRTSSPGTSTPRATASPAARTPRARAGTAETVPAPPRVRRPRRAEAPVAGPGARGPSGVLSGLADIPFIIPIVLLVVGALGLTLFLTTRSAQDSYALTTVRNQNSALQDQRDGLKRTVDAGDSAPELADKAQKLGMVPAADSAHLVVGPDGKARLKGELTPAEGKRLGSLNPAPDPVSQIDPGKVDDSGGLGGQPAPSAAPSASPSTTTPAPAATPSTGSQPPAATTSPATDDQGQIPAPNVLPRGATPSRNNPPQR
ncbi:hypothetical protein MYK68_12600 [Gordonia sp. PP30]|uniref:hypothetical protein n=2 Tax=unclassified Gordonia (in: high G+C Gram-positive bacteria) TaxID=2657482 RepID=UPI001FFFF9A9|nr:hypothetical protein [Gordonia sp. PP30]UQE73589.1 hypothetical protein MYK68_12600 [Gordonia sp. PP30]